MPGRIVIAAQRTAQGVVELKLSVLLDNGPPRSIPRASGCLTIREQVQRDSLSEQRGNYNMNNFVRSIRPRKHVVSPCHPRTKPGKSIAFDVEYHLIVDPGTDVVHSLY